MKEFNTTVFVYLLTPFPKTEGGRRRRRGRRRRGQGEEEDRGTGKGRKEKKNRQMTGKWKKTGGRKDRGKEKEKMTQSLSCLCHLSHLSSLSLLLRRLLLMAPYLLPPSWFGWFGCVRHRLRFLARARLWQTCGAACTTRRAVGSILV